MTHQINTNLLNNNNNNQQTLSYPYAISPVDYATNMADTPLPQGKNNLPAFLNKLYGMVNATETDPWVHWDEGGSSFVIPNSQALADHVLGRHFKHNNFASFVRQLNMYGFHKVPHLNHGVLHNDGLPEVWEFTNINFHRDHPESMRNIVRKKGEAEKARSAARHSPSPSSPQLRRTTDPADVAIVRAELQAVVNRQNFIREELVRLSANNDNLWKYALETRQQSDLQQAKIDNIIKYLSEAFRKRAAASPDLAPKIRGYLEAPSAPSPFEELSDGTAMPTPVPNEHGQLDLSKIFPNGKIPVGLQEVLLQYFQGQNGNGNGNVFPNGPLSPTSPALLQSSIGTPSVIPNMEENRSQQVENWIKTTDNTTNEYPFEPNSNMDFESFLHDSNFVDPYSQAPNFDPNTDLSMLLGPSWYPDPVAPNDEQPQDSYVVEEQGKKRSFEDEEQSASPKRVRF